MLTTVPEGSVECGGPASRDAYSPASCWSDRWVDRSRDSRALPLIWPRGRKVPTVSTILSQNLGQRCGERNFRCFTLNSSYAGTLVRLRRRQTESRREVGQPIPSDETTGTNRDNRGNLFSDVGNACPPSRGGFGGTGGERRGWKSAGIALAGDARAEPSTRGGKQHRVDGNWRRS